MPATLNRARLALWVLVALVAIGATGFYVYRTMNPTALAGGIGAGDYRLETTDGQPFTRASFVGHPSMLFFGFTHCPDVCPTTLAVLKQMRQQLADLPDAQRPHVVLFTVDPERDTPERLRDYVRFFDPSFGATTGTVADVEQAAAAFSVPFAKVTLPQGGYTMDHGAGIFLVDPAGRRIAYSSPPFDAATLARDYRKVLQYYGELGG